MASNAPSNNELRLKAQGYRQVGTGAPQLISVFDVQAVRAGGAGWNAAH